MCTLTFWLNNSKLHVLLINKSIMKKIILLLLLIISLTTGYSQTFNSKYVIEKQSTMKTEIKDRIITLSDKQITISKFIGGVNTQYLIVNKIEEKDYSFDGLCKYYYCSTKDKDPVNGYQKAIVIKTHDEIILGLFSSEIDIYVYHFAIR